MKRTDLVAKLEIVAPALATNTLIPIMTHFWFTGTHVMAHNDAIAIDVPCKTDFAAAVPGLEFLNLLKASRASDIELEYAKGELTAKGSSTRIHLATMDEKYYNFKMPKPGKPEFQKADGAKFFKAIDACLRSVSIDTSIPDMLGVTLIGAGKELLLFATNHDTFSHAWLALPGETTFKRANLNASFCREMVKLASKKGGLTLEVRNDHSLFYGVDDSCLFGKLIDADKRLPYEDIFDMEFPKGSEKQLVTIPTKMELILDRAAIVSTSNVTPALMDISVKSGIAEFVTQAAKIEIFDKVELEKGQPDVRLRVDPKLVKNGYGDFTKMLLTKRGFVMTSGGIYYIVGNSAKAA